MTKTFENIQQTFKREKLMSLTNVLVMTITFTLLGFFIYVIAVSQTTLRYLEEQAQITLFFKDDFTEQNILNLKNNLEKDKRISSTKYVSKSEAFQIFKEINKDEPILLESITADILPASLEVRSKSVSELPKLAGEFSSIDGVEEVRYFQDVIQRFRDFSTFVYIFGFVVVALFFVISYSIIINALRTTIHSKGRELEVMKLVGASDTYVRKPLVSLGMLFGTMSSIIASLVIVLFGVGLQVSRLFPQGLAFGFLPNLALSPIVFSLVLSLLLILSGTLLGYLGSSSAVKKYLKY